jgi:hypothetical protein
MAFRWKSLVYLFRPVLPFPKCKSPIFRYVCFFDANATNRHQRQQIPLPHLGEMIRLGLTFLWPVRMSRLVSTSVRLPDFSYTAAKNAIIWTVLPSPAYTQQLTRSRDLRYRNEPNNYSGAGSIEKANVIYK